MAESLTQTLKTGISTVTNVRELTIGKGRINTLGDLLKGKRSKDAQYVIFFIDIFFEGSETLAKLPLEKNDELFFVDTALEPTTENIDLILNKIKRLEKKTPCAIVGMGGGSTLDTAKAVSNLLTNPGKASDYQGWDLVKNPGVFKIGIPTISGTGAESTRTCVMTNKATGLKLGMNSNFTLFDSIILDPDLLSTVPRDQYFYTGMDAYIHCMESLKGSYRNPIGDALCREVITLCKEIFLSEDMMDDQSRERLMAASYLGGCAIASSYVGLVHPLSAGLSVVFGTHHCLANCMVMRSMEEHYPQGFSDFWQMAEKQQISVPRLSATPLSQPCLERLHKASIIHEKPLTNALGENFLEKLTREHTASLFAKM